MIARGKETEGNPFLKPYNGLAFLGVDWTRALTRIVLQDPIFVLDQPFISGHTVTIASFYNGQAITQATAPSAAPSS